MKKDELTARLAAETGVTQAAAADTIDQVVHDILVRLRRGKPVAFPGLGRFIPGRGFRFESRAAGRRRKK